MLSVKDSPWSMGRQSKRHELTVENDGEETLIKVDDTEADGGDPS